MWVYIVAVVALYVIYVLMVHIFGANYITKSLISEVVSGKDQDIIKPTAFPATQEGQGIRWTMSFWVYLDDMNYKYGQKKYIVTKKLSASSHSSIDVFIKERTPEVVMSYYDSSTPIDPSTNLTPDMLKQVNLGTLPLRKWQHIAIVQDANVIDVFMNGKVVFSSDPTFNIISGNGEEFIFSKLNGWSGYKAKAMYSNYNQNMQEVRSALSDGPLQMGMMNPLYYIYLVAGFIMAMNNSVLSSLLPNPKHQAKKALEDQKKAKKEADADKSCEKEE